MCSIHPERFVETALVHREKRQETRFLFGWIPSRDLIEIILAYRNVCQLTRLDIRPVPIYLESHSFRAHDTLVVIETNNEVISIRNYPHNWNSWMQKIALYSGVEGSVFLQQSQSMTEKEADTLSSYISEHLPQSLAEQCIACQ
jgi:hypothetical protein